MTRNSMPRAFAHRRASVFVPLQRKLDPTNRGMHFLTTYARLKPGVPLERATKEMRSLGETLAREFKNNHGVDVTIGAGPMPLNPYL